MSLRSHAKLLALPWLVGSVCSVAQAHAHDTALQRPLPSLPEYLALGLQHILTGFDHLAFLLGLVLITRRLRPLLLAVTTFTVGHSLSLTASTLELVQLPASWVETAIALSIAYVATLNLRERHGEARFVMSGAFGFIHGFGFAGALREIGLPSDQIAPPLLAFNMGVELGQLAVLCVVLPALMALRRCRSPGVWTRTAQLINVLLLGLGLCWAGERALLALPVAANTPPAASLAVGPSKLPAPSASQLQEAARVCELFVHVPQLRRAECTGQSAPVTFEQPCGRALASALARDAIALVPDELAGCELELSAPYAQCDFAAAERTLRARACRNALRPQLGAGSPCASELECRAGLACLGVSPLRLGTCDRVGPASQEQAAGLDPLARLLPHTLRRSSKNPPNAPVGSSKWTSRIQ